MFERNKPSVVNIANRITFAGSPLDETAGSGFVIDVGKTSCRIGTDNHVIPEGQNKVQVRFPSGENLTADVELRDSKNDLAILRLMGLQDASVICHSLPLSDSSHPINEGDQTQKLSARSGEPAHAEGKVDSYFQRSQADKLKLLPGEDPNRQMIYINGPSDTGDSGGAVTDMTSTVVGIDSANGGGGFAVTPAYFLKRDLEQVQKENGR